MWTTWASARFTVLLKVAAFYISGLCDRVCVWVREFWELEESSQDYHSSLLIYDRVFSLYRQRTPCVKKLTIGSSPVQSSLSFFFSLKWNTEKRSTKKILGRKRNGLRNAVAMVKFLPIVLSTLVTKLNQYYTISVYLTRLRLFQIHPWLHKFEYTSSNLLYVPSRPKSFRESNNKKTVINRRKLDILLRILKMQIINTAQKWCFHSFFLQKVFSFFVVLNLHVMCLCWLLWIYIQFAGSFRKAGDGPTFRDGLKGHENKNDKTTATTRKFGQGERDHNCLEI